MKIKKNALGVCVFVTLVFAVSGQVTVGQEMGGLFIDTSRSNDASLERQRSEAKDPTVIRSRHVEISFNILREEESQPTASSLLLNLFGDVSLIAVKRTEEWRSATQCTWYGHIAGFEQSLVVMVVNGRNVAGNISVEGRMYQVRPVAQGIHSVREIDQSAFPKEAAPIIPEIANETHMPRSLPSIQESAETIDVMVVYTADAANATGDITAEIQLAVDETNAMYENSGINQRIQLVHSAEVDYTETGDAELDLKRLRLRGDGFLDEVHGLRNAYYADLVCLWVEDMYDYCGMANGMVFVTPLFAAWAFSVVEHECATGGYTFAHELGHNMGAHHDWYVFPLPVPYAYSHGYVDRGYRWRTVMAYSDECEIHGTYCPRLPYFSNPDIAYEGTPLGVPEGSPLPADNRKSLNNTAAAVAAFRVEGGPNPWGAADNAEASVHGQNTLSRLTVINELAIILIPMCAIILFGIRNRKE